jgi:hypothetical protein
LIEAVYFGGVIVWAAITNDHKLGGLNNRYLFLTVLKGGRTSLNEDGCFLAFLLYPHMIKERERERERERECFNI